MFSKIIPSFFTIKEGVFSTSPSLLQGELHLSHQASLPSGTRGCNRPPVLGTATLQGWRTIKGLRQVVRDGTALIIPALSNLKIRFDYMSAVASTYV